VKAILFDLDDTLVPERPALDAGYVAIAERVWGSGAGSPERIDSLREAARAVWLDGRPTAYCLRVHFSLGEALHGEFVATGPEADALRAFVPELHARAFDAVLPPAWHGRSPELVDVWRAARMNALAPYDETVAVLERWAARMPVALAARRAAVTVPEELGIGKPEPEPFQAALAALGGLAPDEVVMVGNDADRDVAGARAAGIRPIWLDRGWPAPEPAAERIADLRELEGLLLG
jgi:FMN phosphatase YigB (HAD superfamily)